ncbi:hypothetical protein [Micromonospora sp. 4G55]|uniref:hypothetical protein n=1 Tax=Micromonospora sp. 4G55 TaxID=2806102 RepID=UPI001A3CB651|nr:hypothetical protein [Micromonospora sp. 4G55]MBM0258955.1 hypothetical protein [Micromonospora sp. 4G55]
MGLANLEPLLGAGPLTVAAAVAVPVAGKIIITALALRGTDPKDRPGIIKAVAELFRWRR